MIGSIWKMKDGSKITIYAIKVKNGFRGRVKIENCTHLQQYTKWSHWFETCKAIRTNADDAINDAAIIAGEYTLFN